MTQPTHETTAPPVDQAPPAPAPSAGQHFVRPQLDPVYTDGPVPRAEATEVASAPAQPPAEGMTARISKIPNRFWLRARIRLGIDTTDEIVDDSVALGIVLAVHQGLQETGVEDWDRWLDANPNETNDYLGVVIEDDTKS